MLSSWSGYLLHELLNCQDGSWWSHNLQALYQQYLSLMKTLKHGLKALRVLGRWAWRSWCRSSRSGRSWWSRRRRNISWSSPCLPCPSEVNCQIIHIPIVFLNVGQVNGHDQALIGQTVRGNSSSSTEGSDQGWKSEPRGVTLSNGRNLT